MLINHWRKDFSEMKIDNILSGHPISSLSSWHWFFPSQWNECGIQSPFLHVKSSAELHVWDTKKEKSVESIVAVTGSFCYKK